MVEEQIYKEFVASYFQPVSTPYEREADTQFE
ncbi:hypothetical protein F4827_004135 [Paraburkholderia bannensis]|uniref:Uncharacterized protein n=1 Tax=Paraburkholderia bannensis TaxID=765414 RepID=A0A7W9WUF2_9BURK|nr:hypothetical protein [Paraburkholderia sp. WP4_3_2]MBB6104276.1 hypothetical protein [Paraburkholderia bannensis]